MKKQQTSLGWYVGWRVDRNPPEKVFSCGKTPEKAFSMMTHKGVLIGKIRQKIYGPYMSFKEASEAKVPLPDNTA